MQSYVCFKIIANVTHPLERALKSACILTSLYPPYFVVSLFIGATKAESSFKGVLSWLLDSLLLLLLDRSLSYNKGCRSLHLAV